MAWPVAPVGSAGAGVEGSVGVSEVSGVGVVSGRVPVVGDAVVGDGSVPLRHIQQNCCDDVAIAAACCRYHEQPAFCFEGHFTEP